ncbi:MAG: hypothetical protein JWR21_4358 [Herminiimonas sp.]|nr:hypothetical protein [Herminiimonas sp.]
MQRQRKDGNPLKLPARCHYKHGAFWYVHPTGKWESVGTDIVKARQAAENFNDDSSEHGSMGWYVDEFLVYFKSQVESKKRAERTLLDYRKYSTGIKGYFGHLRPDAVAAHHVKMYLDMNSEFGANREKALLSSTFSWMINNGKGGIKLNPCSMTGRNKEVPRGRYVSDEEYKAVHALATPNAQLAMELMYKTLQRPSDVLRYRRDAITTFNGKRVFRFTQGKTKKIMYIEIDDHFQEMINRGATEGEYLLVARHGTHYTTDGLAAMLHRYQKTGGVESFGLQDLKAKGATDMYQAGVPIEVICELLGHKSVTTTEIYIKQHLKTISATNPLSKKTERSPELA